MKLAFVLYPGFTALDIVGPYEVMSRWPGAEVHWVVGSLDPVRADEGLTVTPSHTFASLPHPDVVIVGGATNPVRVLKDAALIDWIRNAAPRAQWVTSVCTGSGVLAEAGLLQGKKATTHWAFRDNLKAMGVSVVDERVVIDGQIVTGAGVSAGIDMALVLTAIVHGEDQAKSIQLMIEYDPKPPFDEGAPEKASSSTLRLAVRTAVGDRAFSIPGIVGHYVREKAARRVR